MFPWTTCNMTHNAHRSWRWPGIINHTAALDLTHTWDISMHAPIWVWKIESDCENHKIKSPWKFLPIHTPKYSIITADVFYRSQAKVDLSGILPSAQKEFHVIFHVIVPKDAWGFDANKLHMHLRFNHDRLGKWNGNIGEFVAVRWVWDPIILCKDTVGTCLVCFSTKFKID